MRYAGRITEWDDERGFGFVTPNGGGDRAFVHIKSFQRGSTRPVVAQLISYEVRKDERGRCNAAEIRFVDLRAKTKHNAGIRWPRKTVAVLCMAVLVAGWLTGIFPAIVPLIYAGMSILAVLMYALDKSAATRQRSRTPERTLHVVALLGGWPGALFAQNAFRHKSSKPSFQSGFLATVALNCTALAAGSLGWFDLAKERFGGGIAEPSIPFVIGSARSSIESTRARTTRATLPTFSCDGRTHCTQMTSCAEATYFLQHCPNVRMDGDGDGVPCEQQWCN